MFGDEAGHGPHVHEYDVYVDIALMIADHHGVAQVIAAPPVHPQRHGRHWRTSWVGGGSHSIESLLYAVY